MENIGTLKQQTQNGSLQYNPLILRSVPIAAQFNRHLYFGLRPLYKCLDVSLHIDEQKEVPSH